MVVVRELAHEEGSRLTDAELAEVRAVLEASGKRHDRGGEAACRQPGVGARRVAVDQFKEHWPAGVRCRIPGDLQRPERA